MLDRAARIFINLSHNDNCCQPSESLLLVQFPTSSDVIGNAVKQCPVFHSVDLEHGGSIMLSTRDLIANTFVSCYHLHGISVR